MTTLTMRVVKGDFIVTGPDIAPMKFKTRPEARDWCKNAPSRLADYRNRARRQAHGCQEPARVTEPVRVRRGRGK